MKYLILLIFVGFFIVGCNSSTLPPETLITNTVVATSDKVPTNLQYPIVNASFFQNVDVTPNVPSLTGDKSSLSYSIEPSLPQGLIFNSQTGGISGRPTNLMNQTFYTVKAKNDYGLISITISIKIVIPPPSNLTYVGIVENQSFYNFVNLPQTFTPSVSGVVSSYSIEPELPNGMNFDPQTGIISGQPQITDSTKLGIYNFYMVKAINSSGYSSVNLKFKFIDVAPSNLSYQVVDAIYNVGVPISKNSPSYFGGTISLFILDPVNLPAGLFFNSLTGDIQGTPLIEIPQPLTYKITAYNTGGSVDTNIKIRVYSDQPLSLSYVNSNPTYTKDVAIAGNTIIYTGGKPTSFSVNPSLPTGLNLNPNSGIITGVPSDLMLTPQMFTITGTNTGGSVSKQINIRIVDRLPAQIRYESNEYKIRRNEYFSIIPTGNVGGEVSSYSITPALPSGLNFNMVTGEISGNPTTVVPLTSYNVVATNSGGSFSFSTKIEILPAPNYNFDIVLKKKNYIDYNKTNYVFELQNISQEFDNSTGISLAMPISLVLTNQNITTSMISNDCLSRSSLVYLEKCQISIDYQTENPLPITIMVQVKASSVLTKFINLIDYLDISPKNINIIADRPIIEKTIVQSTESSINTSSIASCNSALSQSCTILPMATSLNSNENLANINDKALMQNANLSSGLDLYSYISDPDVDTIVGTQYHNGIQFSSSTIATAQMNGFTSVCSVNAPYTSITTCRLGEFFIGSSNINYSGIFSVNMGSVEGLPSEKNNSNGINVNVYRMKRIGSIPNDSLVSNSIASKRMVSLNNKIYYTGLIDTAKRLMEYDTTTGILKQISNVNSGNDFAYPFAVYNNLVFLKMRDPLTNQISYYSYNPLLNNFNILYSSGIFSAFSSSNEDVFYYLFNNKLFLPAKVQNVNQMVSIDSTNTLRTELVSFYNSTNSNNGLIDRKSLIDLNGNLYFSMKLMDNSIEKGTRLIQYNPILKTQKLIVEKNVVSGSSLSDWLNDPVVYDNKIFYITRSIDNETTSKADLYVFNDSDNTMKRLYSAEKEGKAEILGVKYGKLFFKMPVVVGTGVGESIYFYDANNAEIKKIYTSLAGEKVLKIAKFMEFQDIQSIPFIVQKVTGVKDLLLITRNEGSFVVKNITTSTSTLIDENVAFFTYNNNLFFNCSTDLAGLCSYNDHLNSLSLINDSLKISVDENVPKGQKPMGVVFVNNKLYLSISPTSMNSTITSGLYEMCILGQNGCL